LMAQLAAVRPTAIVTLGQSAAKDVLGPSASLAKDRKSTRLNSSHVSISYAVFCLKKKMTDRPKEPSLTAKPELATHPFDPVEPRSSRISKHLVTNDPRRRGLALAGEPLPIDHYAG